MASKRRNMFYQNKKQETTEIDVVAMSLVVLGGLSVGGRFNAGCSTVTSVWRHEGPQAVAIVSSSSLLSDWVIWSSCPLLMLFAALSVVWLSAGSRHKHYLPHGCSAKFRLDTIVIQTNSSLRDTGILIIDFRRLCCIRYLGPCIDKRVTWNPHTRLKRIDLSRKFGLLRNLLHRRSKLSIGNEVTIHNLILKPTWTYGIEL
ncbi:hypothetical protein AAG570_006546 [Ranatra chinensis]|uniref:Uncharacterized protein n=1 Tax=Ranatra chinensis TaxID=642074 RepID=A0ABD0YWF5_9HEMI